MSQTLLLLDLPMIIAINQSLIPQINNKRLSSIMNSANQSSHTQSQSINPSTQSLPRQGIIFLNKKSISKRLKLNLLQCFRLMLGHSSRFRITFIPSPSTSHIAKKAMSLGPIFSFKLPRTRNVLTRSHFFINSLVSRLFRRQNLP